MKRILAVLLCLLSAYGMIAQERKLQHRPYIDRCGQLQSGIQCGRIR